MVNTNAEKAAKRHVNIQDTPTDFLDQQPFDCANLLTLLVEHLCAFNAITLDDRMIGNCLVACLPQQEAILQYAG
jgi:hypothetical protein